ncbi:cbb3-type cytochrome c oxidase subunit I [Telmatocola sphagniphila]|uniref:Cbb3-type cytochrome c oxidase subunit I n=1 Tax=Telmatocola sphagniphila TaxID=1123043 RepID=A0A8E6EUP6_9BACT|nr:cbb3-type cytochrome c oxidase subunit I [Telmatocola sphagniphila]QVL31552.1 cbb3-type cytochrome c oxidase subunit I [Telmatocola sphagniphila]
MSTLNLNLSPDLKAYFAEERRAIDESCRLPVLVFFGSALVWLIVGTLLGLTASLKMHTPDFLADHSWLTFGRIRPAHLNMVTMGWASSAGLGCSIWLMCRLSRIPLIYPRILLIAALSLNLGMIIALVGVLSGFSQGVEWLEPPQIVAPFMTTALALVSAWLIATLRKRREKHIYVTQWYIFGAMFWMPWMYTVAQLVIFGIPGVMDPARGVVQATCNWWFAHNFLGLWLTPIGVGAAYYIIPKIVGRPVYSYHLSIIGFWATALFYSWVGMHHLIGGPLPAWMVTASIAGSILMIIPVMAVALNHHMTMWGHFQQLVYSPALRFVVFGAITYTAVSIQGSFEALRDMNVITHFTHYTIAHAHLGVYGFYSMVMFGTMYYIVPRLTGVEWASAKLIRLHFWSTSFGITIYYTSLTLGGWYQGQALIAVNELNQPTPFIEIVRYTQPYLIGRSIGGSLMAIGHFVFAYLFVVNVCRLGPVNGGPTYFVPHAQPLAVSDQQSAVSY